MELYELSANNKDFFVYELKDFKNRVFEYKKKRIGLEALDLYTLVSTDKKLIYDIISGKEIDSMPITLGNYDYFVDLYKDNCEHLFEQLKKKKIYEEYLNNKYSICINRNFKDNKQDNSYNFLITEKPSSIIINNQDYYQLDRMLSLPMDLAALHYLEQGNFSVFTYNEALAQAIPFQLFEIDYIEHLPTSFLNLEIINNKNIKDDIAGREKVLTLYRTSQNKD